MCSLAFNDYRCSPHRESGIKQKWQARPSPSDALMFRFLSLLSSLTLLLVHFFSLFLPILVLIFPITLPLLPFVSHHVALVLSNHSVKQDCKVPFIQLKDGNLDYVNHARQPFKLLHKNIE